MNEEFFLFTNWSFHHFCLLDMNTRISGGITMFFLPLIVGIRKRGFFFPLAYIFLPYFLGMALDLPVYKNKLLVCLLGKRISKSFHDLL